MTSTGINFAVASNKIGGHLHGSVTRIDGAALALSRIAPSDISPFLIVRHKGAIFCLWVGGGEVFFSEDVFREFKLAVEEDAARYIGGTPSFNWNAEIEL